MQQEGNSSTVPTAGAASLLPTLPPQPLCLSDVPCEEDVKMCGQEQLAKEHEMSNQMVKMVSKDTRLLPHK